MEKGHYVEENCVTVGISIALVNAIEPLGELNVADVAADLRIHVETHCLTNSLAVVHVVITIEIEYIRSIC